MHPRGKWGAIAGLALGAIACLIEIHAISSNGKFFRADRKKISETDNN
jgi:hypothetical protein